VKRLACVAVILVACGGKREATKHEAKSPAATANDPWAVPAGSGDARPIGSGSIASDADVPPWAHDPPDVLRGKILSVNAHVIVLKAGPMPEYRDVLRTVEGTKGIVAAEPFTFAELEIASAHEANVNVVLKGVDPKRVGRVLTIDRHMKTGSLDSLAKGEPAPIVLGDGLAGKLGVRVGDDVTLTPPKDAPSAKAKVFRVIGTFHVEFDEYDDRLAFTSVSAAQAMSGTGDQVLGVEATVDALDRSDKIATAIETALGGPPYDVMDWYELNKNLFTALYGNRRP
jgi:ABC-type lipoprotein release transport system permease subunit